ncbi:thiolase family protein [Pyrobaculum aerophilum]|uniref:Acetyl-CoA C-acyltransferase n=2 Tax=Pyrobaculum aerophilum TaxID=13773 RepID=Q8ZVP6_PYRAE|nr:MULTISPECIES: thiolase family protein [Pyrobaculum]AAL64010.1 acetyl-CoA C-acyltransferase [Pyrobaculum aerophilum str. IM2]MCX8137268.1 thiolase family protein [Pyrobaculum aerophilum]HII47223.1 thiolase family protein [Pyrobaculum aerophilum]
MKDVYIVGGALYPAGRHYDKNLDDMAAIVLDKALTDAKTDIDAVFVASSTTELANKQQILGAYILESLGIDKVPVFRVENGDGSGSAAIALAYYALRSEEYNCVAVVGVDKPNDVLSNQQQDIYATTLDTYFERYFGFTPLSLAALMAKTYLKKYEYKYEDLARWAVLMHAHGASNPYAYFKRPIKLEDALNSELVSEPLRLYDVGPLADGAAAAVLCNNRREGPKIYSTATATNTTSFNSRGEYDVLYSLQEAARQALNKAGITPRDIATAEVHDSFSIFGVLALEGLGIVKRGGALAALREGDLPVNLSGGFKSRGNMLGATGVYQLVEVAWQLLGKEFKRVDGNYGVIHSMGGVDRISTVVVLGL